MEKLKVQNEERSARAGGSSAERLGAGVCSISQRGAWENLKKLSV